MTDLEKTAAWAFDAEGRCANEPGARAQLEALCRKFVEDARNLDGGTVFVPKGSCPVYSATVEAGFSGWNGAGLDLELGDEESP